MDPLYNALIAIGTAIFTTLVVEWFAKPALDARKERILEERRALRRLLIIAELENWRVEDHMLYGGDLESVIDDNEVEQLIAQIPAPRGKNRHRAYREIVSVMQGDALYWRTGQTHFVLWGATDILTTPWWNRRRRREAISRLDKAIADHKDFLENERDAIQKQRERAKDESGAT